MFTLVSNNSWDAAQLNCKASTAKEANCSAAVSIEIFESPCKFNTAQVQLILTARTQLVTNLKLMLPNSLARDGIHLFID